MVDNVSSKEYDLSVKVVRLNRPKLNVIPGFSIDPTGFDPIGEKIEQVLCKKRGESRLDFPVGEYLVAPKLFENIYLGETFTFLISLVNDSKHMASDVKLRIELQTNSQRLTLPCSNHDNTLEGGGLTAQIISHEIKEVGQHILICNVYYTTSVGDKMYFRKFFKFPVSKPIDVKTKFYNAEDSANNDVYLEAQIENTAYIPMILDKVELEPSPNYTVTSIKPDDESDVCSVMLRPKDIRQFLFCLSPSEQNSTGYKDLTNIGKLDMSWRTSMGDRGRLQTSALQRIAPGYGDVRLSVEQVPACVKARQPFQVMCKLHNSSERSLDLHLIFDGNACPAVVFCSTSGVPLGQLPPNASVPFTIDLLPVAIGFQSISGIRVVDSFLKRTYELDEIAQVFVT